MWRYEHEKRRARAREELEASSSRRARVREKAEKGVRTCGQTGTYECGDCSRASGYRNHMSITRTHECRARVREQRCSCIGYKCSARSVRKAFGNLLRFRCGRVFVICPQSAFCACSKCRKQSSCSSRIFSKENIHTHQHLHSTRAHVFHVSNRRCHEMQFPCLWPFRASHSHSRRRRCWCCCCSCTHFLHPYSSLYHPNSSLHHHPRTTTTSYHHYHHRSLSLSLSLTSALSLSLTSALSLTLTSALSLSHDAISLSLCLAGF